MEAFLYSAMPANQGNMVKKGQRVQITGSMDFEKTEKRWKTIEPLPHQNTQKFTSVQAETSNVIATDSIGSPTHSKEKSEVSVDGMWRDLRGNWKNAAVFTVTLRGDLLVRKELPDGEELKLSRISSPTVTTEILAQVARAAEERAIKANLSHLRAAADYYYLAKQTTEVSYDQLMSPDNPDISKKVAKPVAGEDYTTLHFKQGVDAIQVKTSDGRVITFDGWNSPRPQFSAPLLAKIVAEAQNLSPSRANGSSSPVNAKTGVSLEGVWCVDVATNASRKEGVYTVSMHDDLLTWKELPDGAELNLERVAAPVNMAEFMAQVTRAAEERAIKANLSHLSAAADFYFLRNHKMEVRYDELVGPDKELKIVKPVAGEDYTVLQFRQGVELRIKTADGRIITY